MRQLATNSRRLAVGLSGLILLASCTSGEEAPDSDPSIDDLGSFGLCTDENRPSESGSGRLIVDDPTAAAGDQIAFRWEVDDEVLLGPDLVTECWSGNTWVPVWITRGVFANPTIEIVEPGQEASSNDEGFSDREGSLLIPATAPPGVYRIGFDDNDVRITVT